MPIIEIETVHMRIFSRLRVPQYFVGCGHDTRLTYPDVSDIRGPVTLFQLKLQESELRYQDRYLSNTKVLPTLRRAGVSLPFYARYKSYDLERAMHHPSSSRFGDRYRKPLAGSLNSHRRYQSSPSTPAAPKWNLSLTCQIPNTVRT